MKIAIIAAPYISVPPVEYGGAERRIHALSNELYNRGIDVTLFASGDSKTKVPLIPICGTSLSKDPNYNHQKGRIKRVNKINEKTIELIGNYDLVNVHDYENLDLVEKLSKGRIPILVSIRHSLSPIVKKIYNEFENDSNIHFHGVSHNQIQTLGLDMPFIYNGEDSSLYESVNGLDEKRPYFFSIGNVRSNKGHNVAINLAKKIGLDLIISAGSLYYPAEESYFENVIRPRIDENVFTQKEDFLKHISDGTYDFGKGKIINFGPSNDLEKKVLYKHAMFTQFLGNLEEFGNADACPGVIIESLLSGTPVLGVKGGVSEEMIEEKVTGINISSLREIEPKIKEMTFFNPQIIRSLAIKDYSQEVMAENYIRFYKSVLEK